jgi:radical SAM superfamily enzyme YgiQ (UPF0313 family)
MNVLMVYPRHPLTFWSFKYALKYVSKKAAFPPLGLLTVAALLPADWDIRLIDLNVDKLRDKDLLWADLVMISAMIAQKKSVADVIGDCRRLGKHIVAGGPLFNGIQDEYADKIDHLVLNEAEATLPRFLNDLAAGRPQKIYRSSEFPALSETPIPRWDLIDISKYASLMVQYSRGCPFDCEFCDITATYGKKPRLKSIDQFIRELDALYGRGWRGSVFVVDDNFIGNRRAIKKMLPAVIEWMRNRNYPFEFFTEASIDLADDGDLMHMMTEAGFEKVFIGLESPNEESLKECSKNQNRRRDMTEAVKTIQRSGLAVLGGYIVGFDSDDENIFSRQIKFIQESGVVTAMVGLLNALPNTKLWQRLKAENRLELTASGDNTDGSINFISKMEKQKLLEGYRGIVRTIYSPGPYYRRICEFLKHYTPSGKRQMGRDRIRALLKSIFYIGILGNGVTQWYYWKLFIRSLLFHRKSFSQAITFMIYGQHFRKISRKTT